MRIVEIKAIENNGHRNQIGDIKTIPEGWAIVPESLETPNFPFGNIEVEEINGVMTVTKWTACACPEPEKKPELVNSIDLSSYYAFCASVNSNSIDCAFGKNNEDKILNLGLQLAMYSWFCGDSKTEYPFTELCNCCKLTDIENNNAAFKELWENTTLRTLYMGGEMSASNKRPFPSNRVMSELARGSNNSFIVVVTAEDIANDCLWWAVESNTELTSTYYFNDVFVGAVEGTVKEGLVIRLSACGVNSPGTYYFKKVTNGSSSMSYLYRKTTIE